MRCSPTRRAYRSRARVQSLLNSGIVTVGAVGHCGHDSEVMSFGAGICLWQEPDDVVTWLLDHDEVTFLATSIGRFDLIVTCDFASQRDADEFVAALQGMSNVRTVTNWLLIHVLHESYIFPRWGEDTVATGKE